MREELFLRAPSLLALGVDHGLGTRASEGAPVPRLAQVRQVHGNRVLAVPPVPEGAEADALLTSDPGLALGVRTADCVPILLVDRARHGVAAVHAGWRGTAAQIARLAALALARALGGAPGDLLAVLGPHIGPCCYEVDAPVRRALARVEVYRPASRPGRWLLDLGLANERQLEEAGVPAEQIERVGGCTACDARFSSYRRDGTAARMLHYVRMPGG